MKYLILIDASQDWIAPVERLERAARRGERFEAVVLNVQPPFSRHVAQFSRKADRDALHAERSRLAMAVAIERLQRADIAVRAIAQVGDPARQVTAVAAAERVDEILIGAGRQGALERYALPAGVAGLAALIAAAD